MSHRDCPLNPKNLPEESKVSSDDGGESSSDDGSDSDDVVLSEMFPGAVKPFPYPVGTRVAVQFGDDCYAGQITKLYPGEDLCHVVFTDGDEADYDADQITYAQQLYERKFPTAE